MQVGGPDDREMIRQAIGQIRDLYKEIMQLRNDDRAKYREMCKRLEGLERDRSARLKKDRRLARQIDRQKKKQEKAAKIALGLAPPKKTPSKNSKVDSASHDASKTDENGPKEDEK